MEIKPYEIEIKELGESFRSTFAELIIKQEDFTLTKARELKDYILHCQDRKVFCEVSKELIDYAVGYGTIRLSQLPKNEKIIEEIKKRLLTHTGQTNYITKWDLEQILKVNE